MGRYLYLLILLPIAFISCDDGTVVELPVNPPKLVVNCIGQNERLWQCRVSASKNILEFLPFDPVSDATVDLYEDDKFLESLKLLNSFDKDLYGSQTFSPIPGKSYRINVSANSFTSVSSSFTQPSFIPIDAFEVKFLGPSKVFENSTDLNIRISLTDPAGKNFYAVTMKRKSEDSETPSSAAAIGLSFLDPYYKENKDIFYETIIFSDAFFDSKQTTLELAGSVWDPPGDIPMDYYSAYLMNLSEEYYNYLKTSSLQNATRNDPFAQPVIVENNIQGGFGIFGGFTEASKTILVKH